MSKNSEPEHWLELYYRTHPKMTECICMDDGEWIYHMPSCPKRKELKRASSADSSRKDQEAR